MSRPYRWLLTTVLAGVVAFGAATVLSTGESIAADQIRPKKGGVCRVTCPPVIGLPDGRACLNIDCIGDTCMYICLDL